MCTSYHSIVKDNKSHPILQKQTIQQDSKSIQLVKQQFASEIQCSKELGFLLKQNIDFVLNLKLKYDNNTMNYL